MIGGATAWSISAWWSWPLTPKKAFIAITHNEVQMA